MSKAFQGRKSRERYKNRKLEIFSLLGSKCAKCNQRDERVLQIDHRYSDGNKERGLTRTQLYKKVEKNPRRYQLLCANHNWIKREKDFKVQARDNVWWRTKRALVIASVVSLFIIAIGVYHAT